VGKAITQKREGNAKNLDPPADRNQIKTAQNGCLQIPKFANSPEPNHHNMSKRGELVVMKSIT